MQSKGTRSKNTNFSVLNSMFVSTLGEKKKGFSTHSRIRLNHPPPGRTKVADVSGWMIKPMGPNSSSKCQLCCENNQIR